VKPNSERCAAAYNPDFTVVQFDYLPDDGEPHSSSGIVRVIELTVRLEHSITLLVRYLGPFIGHRDTQVLFVDPYIE